MSTPLETLVVKIVADLSGVKTGFDRSLDDLNRYYKAVQSISQSAASRLKAAQGDIARAATSSTTAFSAQTKALQSSATALNQQASQLGKLGTAYQSATAKARAFATAQTAAVQRAASGASSLGTAGISLTAGGLGAVGRYGSSLLAGATATAGAGAAVAGPALKSFASFEDQITRAIAVAGGASNQQRELMVANAKAIGSSGLFSATQVAEGYKHLIAAGLTVEETQKAIGTTQRFATASGTDLAVATERLVQAQTALGMRSADASKNAEGMRHVGDVITKAANISTASINDFALAINTKSGAAARILGKSVEETTAALAAFANQGVKGELAGQQLYMMLRDVQTATLKAPEAWKAMGISVFDASGKMRNVADIVEQFERVLGSATNQQQRQVLMSLKMQDRSIGATQQLIGLSGAIRDYEKALRSAGGETDKVASIIETSFLSQMKILWNQINKVAIDLGEKLAPAIETLLPGAREELQPTVKLLESFGVTMDSVGMGAVHVAIGVAAAWRLARAELQILSSNAALIRANFDSEKFGLLGNKKAKANADLRAFTAAGEIFGAATDQQDITSGAFGIRLLMGTINRLSRGTGGAAGGVRAPGAQLVPKTQQDVARMLGSLDDEKEEAAATKVAKKAETAASRARKALENEGKRLHDSVRTPLEKVNDELTRAKELLKQNVISADDYMRLQEDLYAKLDKPAKKVKDHASRAESNSVPSLASAGPGSAGFMELYASMMDRANAAVVRQAGPSKAAIARAASLAHYDAVTGRDKLPGLRAVRSPSRDEFAASFRAEATGSIGGGREERTEKLLERIATSSEKSAEELKSKESLELVAADFD